MHNYSLFIDKVWQLYDTQKRDLPWRHINELTALDRGYRVLVSEMMLQQTQVSRVVPKYHSWLKQWPTLADFMEATLADAIVAWSGLGYNRRAKYLFESLHAVFAQYNGIVPPDVRALTKLPGLGTNTAAAVVVYTHDLPVAFIETNIRTVYLHEFFPHAKNSITDADILKLVNTTIDTVKPREWFYALMDYGTYIKKTYGNQLYKSHTYKKQAAFIGSRRQVRGSVILLLRQTVYLTRDELHRAIDDDRLDSVLADLIKEGLITSNNTGSYRLASG